MQRPLRLAVIWIAPLLPALWSGWALRERRLDLLDASIPRFVFGDSASGGRSDAWSLPGSPWRFGHRLRPGFAFPYAAAGLRLDNRAGARDLERFDSLVVEWRSRQQRSLRVQIQTFEPGFTDTASSLSFVPVEGALAIGPEWSRASVALRDLAIPLWWNQVAGVQPRARPHALRRTGRLFLENGMESPLGTDDTVEIRVLELRGATWIPLLASILASLLASALLHALLARRAGGKAPPPEVPVRDVPMESRRDEEVRRLLEWAGARYADPLLDVETAGRETGIHPRRIPSVLRAAGRGSFPAFVNSLRVAQAGRLLRGTDRTVSEIAAAVGVPNVPHFHRIFKAGTGLTPLEWRARRDDGT